MKCVDDNTHVHAHAHARMHVMGGDIGLGSWGEISLGHHLKKHLHVWRKEV